MHDQGIGEGAPLGLKDPNESHRVKGIPRQSIDCFGRNADYPSPTEFLNGFMNTSLPSYNPSTHLK